jgi:hypothetical protein
MISLWPFRKEGGRIQDVKAPQMAEATMKSLQKLGRNNIALRMLYRTLELDPCHPNGLLVLSELFRGKEKGVRPKGDEIFSGIIIEYAMDPKTLMPADQKPRFEKARLEVMTLWGYVTPRGGETDVDHLGYMTHINELMGQVRSVANGFKMALAKLGVQAGAYDPVKGAPTHTYQEWLHSDTSTLHL